jgi:hypothetical protein
VIINIIVKKIHHYEYDDNHHQESSSSPRSTHYPAYKNHIITSFIDVHNFTLQKSDALSHTKVNGILALTPDIPNEYQLRVKFEEQYDPIQIVLRCVFMIAAIFITNLFKVPKVAGA